MDAKLTKLEEPKYVDGQAMHIAGLSGEYTRETTGEIPKQWEKFNAELSAAGLADNWTFGVVYPTAVMRYVSGVEIAAEASVPEGWAEVIVPAQRYAVFAETGGIEAIRKTWMAIFSEWIPKAGIKVADGPMLERYQEDWTTSGDFEIWVPVG